MTSKKDLAKKQFGKRVTGYTRGIFSDEEHLKEISTLSGLRKEDNVLDVATGAGFLAFEYSKIAKRVVATDITPEMLEKAKNLKNDRKFKNVSFITADVEDLPFENKIFDLVSCRFSFHHFPDPRKALEEMKRVCKKDGKIVLIDGISSEDDAKSDYLNKMERIRDKSHVCLYKLSELQNLFDEVDLEVIIEKHWDLDQYFDEWIERADPDYKDAKKIEEMMKSCLKEDHTGLNVRLEDGRIKFTYDTVIVIAKRL